MIYRVAGLVLLLLVMGGCSPSADKVADQKAPEPIVVSGKVQLSTGDILKGGTLNFQPLKGKGIPATATIQEDGSFTPKSAGKDGLVPGEYAVSVRPIITKLGDKNQTQEVRLPQAKLVPEKYWDEGSPLRFTMDSSTKEIFLKLDAQ